MPIFSLLSRWMSSFQFRLFAALALMIIIFIPTLGYFSYLRGKASIETQIERYAKSTAEQIAGRIQAYLSHHTSNVRLMKSFLENHLVNSGDPDALIAYFHLLKREYPGFINILYGDQSGRFIMVPPQPPEIHSLFDPRLRPWYTGALEKNTLFWTPVYLFASTRKPGITASLAVKDARGKVAGVCGIDIDLSTFSAFLAKLHIAKGGNISIIENSTGHIVAHPGLTETHPDLPQISRINSCLADLRARSRRFGIANCSDGNYFTAYADYPDNDWTVCITLPESEYLQQLRRIRRTTLSITLAAMGLALIISYLLALTLIRPMDRLRRGIEEISRGNLDIRLAVENPDLIGSMAVAVNEMAASLKKSRHQLRRTLADLAEKEKMAALGQLTAGIAHEIKNPLGIILGSAEVMNNPHKPIEMRERAARFVIDEVTRLNRTLINFLDFARPAPPRFEKCDVQLILEDTLIFCSDQLRTLNIGVEKSLLSHPPTCSADPDQLHQVFMNLILNAVDAMPDGGKLTVASAVQSGDFLIITLADTGVGMTAAQQRRIFEPFRSFKDEGTGLGLAVVQQIIKMHRATIRVQSTPQRGTKFTLVFPCTERGHP